jgi:uncharacterized membrane protein YgcG
MERRLPDSIRSRRSILECLALSNQRKQSPASDGSLRRLVHAVDTWSKARTDSFVVIVLFASIGSLVWFLASLAPNVAVFDVLPQLICLFLFAGLGIATLLYDMLLVPYIRRTDGGLRRGRAGMELLATVGEVALEVTIGEALGGGTLSSASSSSGWSGSGSSFGGGGAGGGW